MSTFDQKAYDAEVATIRSGYESDLVRGQMLFRLACERKLKADPPLPLNAEEIAGGLRGDRNVDLQSRAAMLETLALVLPFAEQIEVGDYGFCSAIDDMVHGLAYYADQLRGYIPQALLRRVTRLLEHWGPSLGLQRPQRDWRENLQAASTVTANEVRMVTEELLADQHGALWEAAQQKLPRQTFLGPDEVLAGLRLAFFSTTDRSEKLTSVLELVGSHLRLTATKTSDRVIIRYVVAAAQLANARLPPERRAMLSSLLRGWLSEWPEGEADDLDDSDEELRYRSQNPTLVSVRTIEYVLSQLGSASWR